MNSQSTFKAIYVVVFLIAFLVRVYFSGKALPVIERKYKKKWKKVAETEGMLSAVFWSILPIFWVSFTLFYAVLHLEVINKFAVQLPIWLRWIGICLGIVAIPLQFWIHHTIGKYWITYLDLRQHHCLIIDGPYRWVRHPMYFQTIMFLAGLSLISANLLMIFASLIVIILILNRIPREERMMTDRFGDDYRKYMKQAGRLLPNIMIEIE